MSDSKIEWTDRSDWNPIRGCTRVSPGCGGPGPHGGCYAEAIAGRFSDPGQPFHGFAIRTSKGPRWTGKVEVMWDRLLLPLGWRKPAMIFGSSTSDLFHEALPAEAIAQIYAVGIAAHHLRGHTIQWLTKRPRRARELLNSVEFWDEVNATAEALVMERVDPLDRRSDDARATLHDYGPGNPPPGIWLGTSVEDQARADERIPHLLATPAAVRFLSCEPLLGAVNLSCAWVGECALDSSCWGDCAWCEKRFPPLWNCGLGRQSQAEYDKGRSGIDWVIVGGESGKGARPMHPEWARSLRDQCAAAGVPFHFKQWGEWAPICELGDTDDLYHPAPARNPEASRRCKVGQCVLHDDGERFDGRAMSSFGAFLQGKRAMTMFKVGKAKAGRLLDGVEHNGFPA